MHEALARNQAACAVAVRTLPFKLQGLFAARLEVAHFDIMRTGVQVQRDAPFDRGMKIVVVDDALAIDIERRAIVRRQEQRVTTALLDDQLTRGPYGKVVDAAVRDKRIDCFVPVKRIYHRLHHRRRGEVHLAEVRNPAICREDLELQAVRGHSTVVTVIVACAIILTGILIAALVATMIFALIVFVMSAIGRSVVRGCVMCQAVTADELPGSVRVRPLPFKLQRLLTAGFEVEDLDLVRTGREVKLNLLVHRRVQTVIVDHALAVDIKRGSVVGVQEQRIGAAFFHDNLARGANREIVGPSARPEGLGPHGPVDGVHDGFGVGRDGEIDLAKQRDVAASLEEFDLQALTRTAGGRSRCGLGLAMLIVMHDNVVVLRRLFDQRRNHVFNDRRGFRDRLWLGFGLGCCRFKVGLLGLGLLRFFRRDLDHVFGRLFFGDFRFVDHVHNVVVRGVLPSRRRHLFFDDWLRLDDWDRLVNRGRLLFGAGLDRFLRTGPPGFALIEGRAQGQPRGGGVRHHGVVNAKLVRGLLERHGLVLRQKAATGTI